MLSIELRNPPPPERLGGAYELPPPPVVSANSAKDSLTPFDFFFVSFTLAAAPSDGKDESPASAGVGSSPSDGNADAGGPRESNPSSFSSVCARERKTKEETRQSSRFPPINRPRRYPYPYLSRASFNSEPTQRNLKKTCTHPKPTPRRPSRVSRLASRTRANRREKFPSMRFPSVPRHPRVARRHTARTLNSDRRRDVSRGMNSFPSVHARRRRTRIGGLLGMDGFKNIYAHSFASSMRGRWHAPARSKRSRRCPKPSSVLCERSGSGESYCGVFFTKCHH